MNCTIRKTKKASVARYLPISSGVKVLISSSFWNRTYCGMISTWYGSRSVPIMTANMRFRPAKRTLAKA